MKAQHISAFPESHSGSYSSSCLLSVQQLQTSADCLLTWLSHTLRLKPYSCSFSGKQRQYWSNSSFNQLSLSPPVRERMQNWVKWVNWGLPHQSQFTTEVVKWKAVAECCGFKSWLNFNEQQCPYSSLCWVNMVKRFIVFISWRYKVQVKLTELTN